MAKERGIIYLITDGSFFKIGRTNKDAVKRLKELQTGNSSKLELLQSVAVCNPSQVESTLHRRYSYCQHINEWFDLTPQDVELFKENCLALDANFELLKKPIFI